MTRIASLMIIALMCSTPRFASSCGTDALTKDNDDCRTKYEEVYRLKVNSLIEATLAKSKDLATKGSDTYFCEYSMSAEAKPCGRLDTVSGQYEDYYQSQMACKQRCPHADITQSSWTYIAGTKRICRDLATGSCEKMALTIDQVRGELIDLLELEEKMDHRPGSSRADQTASRPLGEQ